MIPISDEAPQWHHAIRIRPDNRTGELRLVDIENGETRTLDGDELAEAIGAGTTLRSGGTQAEMHNETSWQHWRRRSWHPSDDFYVASRRPRGTDQAQPGSHEPATEVTADDPDGWIPLGQGRTTVDAERLRSLLLGRRTERVFHKSPVDQVTTAAALWMGFDEVRTKRQEQRLLPAPQSDMWYARRSTSVGVIVYDVDGLEPGSYHYDIDHHRVQLVRSGQHREAMVSALQGMRTPNTAAWTLIIFADTDMIAGHPNPERMMRSVFVAAGVLGQAIIVGAEDLDMATLVTPAQKDSDVVALLDLDDRRFLPLYTLTAGLKRRRKSDRTEWHG